jgi:hypothetical protein
MRIRIIPDLHGSDWWKEEIKDIDELDHCIFLGDYVDDWDAKNEVIFKNLEEIISFKKEYMDKVTLLYGNHEFNYIHPYTGYCSGFRPTMKDSLGILLFENKNLFQICKLINISLPLCPFPQQKLLFSHAGFSKNWIKDNYYWINEEHWKTISEEDWKKFKDFQLDNLEEVINNSFDSYTMLDKVMSISRLRGGCSPEGGPLWADMRETFNRYLLGYRQFVGHTPSMKVTTGSYPDRSPENSSITFCDCGSKRVDITLDITNFNIVLIVNNESTILC